MIVGDIYKTNNFGFCEVIKYESSKSVVVRFLDTGYETSTTSGVLVRGQLRDKLVRTVCGIGFLGDGAYETHKGGVRVKGYSVWKSMIERCYSESLRKNYPTYVSCKVCDDWHNYQTFAKWYLDNYPRCGGDYELDKDLSSYGCSGKIYSPETCIFVTRAVNSEESHAKSYRVVSPSGDVLDIYNMSKFCRDNGLNIGAMCGVGNGTRNYHKGYTPIVRKTNYKVKGE